jgi:hypothetical protein
MKRWYTDANMEEAIRLLVLCERALAGRGDVDFLFRQVRSFLSEAMTNA